MLLAGTSVVEHYDNANRQGDFWAEIYGTETGTGMVSGFLLAALLWSIAGSIVYFVL